MKKYFALFVLFVLFYGCSSGPAVYYDVPREFLDTQLMNNSISDCSSGLSGLKIFLDPGHGGEDRKNTGPMGIAIEADVNLRVSLYLRSFLEQAGATVFLSRDIDKTVSLKDRSIMANQSGADIFISVHHNAPGKAGDNWTNYTSTYYHATESDFEFEPMEKDLAKFIQRDLAFAMRNSGGLGSFDGTYSDYWIYPKAGFSVLRHTEIPAVLLECGFHTHNWEEQRLALEDFNKIQAWGIFKGLCRYFKTGVPKISFVTEEINNGVKELFFKITDKNTIDPNSIKVFFDSTSVNSFLFDARSNQVKVSVNDDSINACDIRIIAVNSKGNTSFPFRYKFVNIK